MDDYNLDKELFNQKEKLWKVLVYWFRNKNVCRYRNV